MWYRGGKNADRIGSTYGKDISSWAARGGDVTKEVRGIASAAGVGFLARAGVERRWVLLGQGTCLRITYITRASQLPLLARTHAPHFLAILGGMLHPVDKQHVRPPTQPGLCVTNCNRVGHHDKAGRPHVRGQPLFHVRPG